MRSGRPSVPPRTGTRSPRPRSSRKATVGAAAAGESSSWPGASAPYSPLPGGGFRSVDRRFQRDRLEPLPRRGEKARRLQAVQDAVVDREGPARQLVGLQLLAPGAGREVVDGAGEAGDRKPVGLPDHRYEEGVLEPDRDAEVDAAVDDQLGLVEGRVDLRVLAQR